MAQVQDESRTREKLDVTVRKTTSADNGELHAVLARAFDDDPLANWMALQDRRRARRVYDAMGISMKISMPLGEVYTTDGIHGGALWAPPGRWKMGMLQQLLLAPSMARVATWRRIPKILGGINAIEKKHPDEPHYYLFVLGTDPEHQGKGVGTQLMSPVLERCDREKVPAYLESSKERNVPLYERMGFRVVEDTDAPGGGPHMWFMRWDPG